MPSLPNWFLSPIMIFFLLKAIPRLGFYPAVHLFFPEFCVPATDNKICREAEFRMDAALIQHFRGK